jgi:hypothetical protein
MQIEDCCIQQRREGLMISTFRLSRFLNPLIGVFTLGLIVARPTAGQLAPVSWHLHAQASADTVTDMPPDIDLGAVYGSHTVNAVANATNGQQGTFDVQGIFNASSLSMHLGGSATTPAGVSASGGSGQGDIQFSVAAPLSVKISQLRSGASSFAASTWLINSGGMNLYTGSSTDVTLLLPADTYTVSSSGSIGPVAGNPASGFILTTFTVVPEPAALSAIVGALFALRARTPRRSLG